MVHDHNKSREPQLLVSALTLMTTEELHRVDEMSMEGGGPPHSRSPYAPPPSLPGPWIALKSVDLQRVMIKVLVVRMIMVP